MCTRTQTHLLTPTHKQVHHLDTPGQQDLRKLVQLKAESGELSAADEKRYKQLKRATVTPHTLKRATVTLDSSSVPR